MRLKQENCIPYPLQSGFYCQDTRFQHQLILILCLLPVLVVGWNCWTLMRARNSHWPWVRRGFPMLTESLLHPIWCDRFDRLKTLSLLSFCLCICAVTWMPEVDIWGPGLLSTSLGTWLLASTLLRQRFLFFIRLQISGKLVWGQLDDSSIGCAHLDDPPVLSDVHITSGLCFAGSKLGLSNLHG